MQNPTVDVLKRSISRAFVNTDVLSRYKIVCLFEEQDTALEAVFEAGYLAGAKAMADSNDTLTRGLRDEYAERFVRSQFENGATGTDFDTLNVAFTAWLQDEHPAVAPLVLAKRCTKAINRKMDALGIGRRGTVGGLPARVGIQPINTTVAVEQAVKAHRATASPSDTLRQLTPIVTEWASDYVFPSRIDEHHEPAATFKESIRRAMGDRYPIVKTASDQALMRTINKVLDTMNIGERSRGNATTGRRRAHVFPRPIEEMVDSLGRDEVARLVHFDE